MHRSKSRNGLGTTSITVDVDVDIDEIFDTLTAEEITKILKARGDVLATFTANEADYLRAAIRDGRDADALALIDRLEHPQFPDPRQCKLQFETAVRNPRQGALP